MASLDLDARRAARAEATGEPHEVTLGGEVFRFRPRIPLEALDLMAEGKFRPAFRLMLFDDRDGKKVKVTALDRFFSHVPDDADLEDIVEGLYGQAPGEFSASPASSANGGRPQRPIGKATTTATSRRTVTARPK